MVVVKVLFMKLYKWDYLEIFVIVVQIMDNLVILLIKIGEVGRNKEIPVSLLSLF
jgi:hypothetical protein